MNNLLTIKETMQYLKISRSTLNQLVRDGKIKIALRVGKRGDRRFRPEEIERFIEGK